MDSLILCYAPGDEAFARRLAGFLEINLPLAVSRSESLVGPELDLVEAAERALSAEVALVLLSPRSVPRVWDLQTWKPVFLEKPKQFQTQLGFVLVDDCKFPQLLRRERFFDASNDELRALREIKRWLLRPAGPARPRMRMEAEMEDLERALADQPGAAFDIEPETAAEFSEQCGQDFEAVYGFDCCGRSRAGIVGDIRGALGLPFSGRLEDDRATLAEWSATHRALFILAGVRAEDREFAMPGGRVSTLFTAPGSLAGSIQSAAGDAVRDFEETACMDAEAGLRLGWAAANLLKAQGRFAEVLEVLDAMAAVARDRGDTSAILRIEREQYWMRVHQSADEIPALEGPHPGLEQQLSLPFF